MQQRTSSKGTSSLGRGMVYTFLTQVPTLVLYFVASTLMTRLLGDTGRGEYALLVNLGALLVMMVGMNLGFGITYYAARSSTDARHAIGLATSMLLINMVLVAIVLWAMSAHAPITSVFMPPERLEWPYWAYVYLTVVLGLVNSSVAGLFLGLKRFRTLNGMSIFTAASSAVGFTVLYLLKDAVAPDRMFSVVLAITAGCMFLVTMAWCLLYAMEVREVPRPLFTPALVRPILAFSLVGHVSNLVNLINYRFDVWVVEEYEGHAALGLYAVAVGLTQMLFHIPDNFSRVVQPFLFGAEREAMLGRFKVIARFNFTAVFVVLVVLGTTAHWLVPALFGEVFTGSVMALYLLLPGTLFCSAFKLLAQLVVQGGLQRFNLLATAAGAVVTIVLDLVLIPRWGITGAALASTASYFTIFLIVALVIRFRLGVGLRDAFVAKTSDLALLRDMSRWRTTA